MVARVAIDVRLYFDVPTSSAKSEDIQRAAREELERRLPRPGRAEAGKLASLDTLRELLESHDLFTPVPGRESLEIDNTALAPEEVAGLILSHYHLPAA